MCGRFALKHPPRELRELYHTVDEVAYAAGYNIAPGSEIVAIAGEGGERRMRLMRWGLVPSWAKDYAIGQKLINARAETVEEKPAFRASFKRRRCVIPASGFVEWQAETREPYYFSGRAGVLSLAGLWDRWNGPLGREVVSCAIVTTQANDLVKPVHERMPVILEGEGLDAWLSDTDDAALLKPLLVPCSGEVLQCWAVSRKVNNPANDSAELLDLV
jgi:putative SOS response-associated peptidase YedK